MSAVDGAAACASTACTVFSFFFFFLRPPFILSYAMYATTAATSSRLRLTSSFSQPSVAAPAPAPSYSRFEVAAVVGASYRRDADIQYGRNRHWRQTGQSDVHSGSAQQCWSQ